MHHGHPSSASSVSLAGGMPGGGGSGAAAGEDDADSTLPRSTSGEPPPSPALLPDLSFAPNRRPLPSYASEPPSVLHAMAAMAAEEAAAAAALPASPFSGSPVKAPPEVNWRRNSTAARGAPPPAPAATREEFSWARHAASVPGGHSMAGDLAMPAAAAGMRRRGAGAAQGARSRSPSPLSAAAARGAPARLTRSNSLRRPPPGRPLELDDSSSDDGGGGAIGGKHRRTRSPKSRGGTYKDKDGSSSDFGQGDEDAGPARPFYRRARFWVVAVPVVFMVAMLVTGAMLLEFGPDALTTAWQGWRLCFFLAGLPIIWWVGDGVTRALVLGVERSMFTVRNALYFAYAVRKPLRNVLRAAMALGWWALMMTVDTGAQNAGFSTAYEVILRLWACVTLFMTANLLKTLLAKLLASKVRRDTKASKMKEALQKEQWLHTLLQPQSHAEPEQAEESSGGRGAWALRAKSVSRLFAMGGPKPAPAAGEERGDLRRAATAPLGNLTRAPSALDSLRFWRRSSAPLEAISERASSLELSRAGVDLEDGKVDEVKITIDLEADPAGEGALPLTPPPLPPLRAKPSVPPVPPLSLSLSLSPSRAAPRLVAGFSPVRPRQGAPVPGSPFSRSTAGGASPLRRQASGGSSMPSRHTPHPADHISAHVAPRARADSRGHVRSMVELENYIRKNALKVTFRDSLNRVAHSKVNTEEEAQNVARFLFFNVAGAAPGGFGGGDGDAAAATTGAGGLPAIAPSDLEPFLPADQAREAFAMLDDDGDGAATVGDCEAAVLKILRQRRHLAASLQDTRSIVAVLEVIIGVGVHVLFSFIYLVIFRLDVGQIWISASGLVLAFTFVFGNSVRAMFENVVFLFMVHPYDVGDTLFLDADFHSVEEISLNFTVCLNSSNQRVWVPNQRLCSTTFINLSASGNRTETMKVLVDLDTPPAAVDDLGAALTALAAEIPVELASTNVSLRESAQPMKMTVNVGYEFTHSGTDLGRTARTRTRVYLAVAKELTRAGVAYTWPAMRGGAPLGPGVAAGAAVGGGGAELDG